MTQPLKPNKFKLQELKDLKAQPQPNQTSRTQIITSQFKKDVKLMEKRGKDLSKMGKILHLLLEGSSLPPHYKDHPLSGNRKDLRDCHIEPDWLLLYKLEGEVLHLIRTGSHADLFE